MPGRIGHNKWRAFWYSGGQNILDGFGMEPESVERIFTKLDAFYSKLGNAGGLASFDETTAALLQSVAVFGTGLTDYVCAVTKQSLGCTDIEPTINGVPFHEVLAAYATARQLREGLSSLPDKDATTIETILDRLAKVLPEIRTGLLGFANGLPTKSGGRPRLFTPHQETAIRRSIALLLADGVSLQIAQDRIARREGASARTIKRIWSSRKQAKNCADQEATGAERT